MLTESNRNQGLTSLIAVTFDESEIRSRDMHSALDLGGANYNAYTLDGIAISRGNAHVVRFVRPTKSSKVKIRTYTEDSCNEVRIPDR